MMPRGSGKDAATVAVPNARGRGGAWTPTDLQRQYRTILDSAKEKRQLVHDKDGSLLVIEKLEDVDFEHQLVKHQTDIAQFMAVNLANATSPPAEWASQTPYPWVGSLSNEDAFEFQSELIQAHFHAAQNRTLEYFEGTLAAWRSTAEIKGDPAQMTALFDVSGPISEVFPPSSEQVERAGGDA